ncbi:MotA/TolQ/ExbB proton channel family protein [Actibacterium sp. D379-3]
MSIAATAHDRIAGLVALGGPVVMLLLGLSVLSLAITLYKLAEYQRQRLGHHRGLTGAVALWRDGRRAEAIATLANRQGAVATLLREAMQACLAGAGTAALRERMFTRAEAAFGRLQSGFRLLDSIAQIAPLLGLFGTVLGMIDAFRALQDAGAGVDPSVLAGGIWVALMTTAVGLAVAMPTALILTWFEARIARERLYADEALEEVLNPGMIRPAATAVDPAGYRAQPGAGHAA